MLALLGLIQMKAGRMDEAEATLRKTIEMEPTFAKPHEDLAVLYMHRQRPDQAEPLFRRLVTLEPNLQSAWFGLAHALRALGRNEEANTANRRSIELSPLTKLLKQAQAQQELGKLAEARELCEQVLKLESNNIQALRLLAVIATKEGNADETERHLIEIAGLAPNAPLPLTELARFYASHKRHIESLDYLQRSVALDPSDSATQLELAESLALFGLPERALKAYEAAESMGTSTAGCLSGKAHMLRALGRTDEAIDSYRRCIESGPNASEAWWSLSSLRTYAFTDAEVQTMTTLHSDKKSDENNRTYLDFALGKSMDDRQRYDEAWAYYTQGNAARRKQVYYDGASIEADFIAIIEASNLLHADTSSTQSNSLSTGVTPIFVLGMPRSGSTLVEQILASHSQVESTTELPYMLALGKHHLTQTNPVTVSRAPGLLSTAQLAHLGKAYLQSCQLHRTQGKPYFIDKMPDNFQMIGLISRLFPHAKIIDIRRNPLDTCVANYRQLFIQGKDFSYDLFELGEYYLQYLRMMEHWDALLPGMVLHVQYEKLVNNTEAEISRLLSYCDLEWQDSCLNFHQTKRSITSASSEQVTQEIYNSAVLFWQNYESHLKPLRELLQSAPLH